MAIIIEIHFNFAIREGQSPELSDIIVKSPCYSNYVKRLHSNDIIPCSCGAYRKVIQNKKPDSLLTQCQKCGSQEPFNIADLTILAGGLLKLAIADGNNTELKPPNVTYDQVFQMIEDIQNHEHWVKEIEGQTLRRELKMLKGGLSK